MKGISVNKFLIILALASLAACVTTPIDQKRKAILDCVKDLKGYDIDSMDAFEICSKIYKLNSEGKPKADAQQGR